MKNFTAVTPIEQKKYGIGQLQTVVTGNDMDWSGVSSNGGEDFFQDNLFVDNCKSCSNMKSLDGYSGYGDYGTTSSGGSGFNFGNVFSTLGNVANSYFQSKTSQNAAEIAGYNAQSGQYQVQNQQAQNAGASIENQGKVAIIKAYIVPISIVGGLAILGIATYFIFKKKKIN